MNNDLQLMRRDLIFHSQGIVCHAWHYRARTGNKMGRPCIVMANGLAGTRASGLEPYAERLMVAGFDVLLFDYRFFGDSQGEPRQLLTVGHQLDDWRAAVAFARNLPGVDPERVALWGVSLSGGHVVSIAAEDQRIAAISALVPMVDGRAALGHMLHGAGLSHLLKLSLYGAADRLRGLFGMTPLLIPVVAGPGEFAVLSSADANDGYSAVAAKGWVNRMSARIALTLGLYRPIAKAHQIVCPVLIQAGMKDAIVSSPAAIELGRRIGTGLAEVRQHASMGHFDGLVGQGFETTAAEQVGFFQRVLASR